MLVRKYYPYEYIVFSFNNGHCHIPNEQEMVENSLRLHEEETFRREPHGQCDYKSFYNFPFKNYLVKKCNQESHSSFNMKSVLLQLSTVSKCSHLHGFYHGSTIHSSLLYLQTLHISMSTSSAAVSVLQLMRLQSEAGHQDGSRRSRDQKKSGSLV